MTESNKDSQFAFFVYVIESPSPVDLYHFRGEGSVLQQAIKLNRITCVHRVAVNREAFEAALQIGLTEAMNEVPGTIPILHISAHGFSEGIQLTSGQVINWAELRTLLIPVNNALFGALLVCMSTCEGYSGTRMAMVEGSEEHPFYAIVGNGSKPTWSETAVGFATFYHHIAKGRHIDQALEAMRMASGNENFFATTAELSKKGYLQYIESLNASAIQSTLEQQAEAAGGADLQKRLAVG